jgi:hypothetical protein
MALSLLLGKDGSKPSQDQSKVATNTVAINQPQAVLFLIKQISTHNL